MSNYNFLIFQSASITPAPLAFTSSLAPASTVRLDDTLEPSSNLYRPMNMVLAGGGVKAIAHVGALKVSEPADIEPLCLSTVLFSVIIRSGFLILPAFLAGRLLDHALLFPPRKNHFKHSVTFGNWFGARQGHPRWHDNFYVRKADRRRTIGVPSVWVSATDFSLSHDDAKKLLGSSVSATQNFLSHWNVDSYVKDSRPGADLTNKVTVNRLLQGGMTNSLAA